MGISGDPNSLNWWTMSTPLVKPVKGVGEPQARALARLAALSARAWEWAWAWARA
jgi:hypothetical protein